MAQTFVGKLGTSDADSGKWTYLNNARCSDDGTTFTTVPVRVPMRLP